MSRDRPIRVLHLRDSPWVDGPGRTILETAARIDRSRIDYHIAPLVPDDGANHPLVLAARERGVPVHPVHDAGDSLSALTGRVMHLVERLNIEILHSSEFRTNIVASRCRSRRPALRLVSTAHGWIANDWRGHVKAQLGKLLLRRFDRVILVSHAMRRRLPAWIVPDARVRVIHNALPIENYARARLHGTRIERQPGGPVSILAVGRLSREKAFDLLLRAIAELVAGGADLELRVAGVGPLESELRALASALGLRDKVKWLGYVSDMPALYSQCDLVVQSSLTEGLPNVMLEVAYLGLPVVATDVGGTSEVIEHGINGWLVPGGSVDALLGGIRHYIEHPQEFRVMAARGTDRVVANFSLELRTGKQTACYEELA